MRRAIKSSGSAFNVQALAFIAALTVPSSGFRSNRRAAERNLYRRVASLFELGILTWIRKILVVDERLSVGAASFQKKCLGKIEDVTRNGRRVLLVTNNLKIVRILCKCAVLIVAGRISRIVSADEVVARDEGM